MIFQKMMKNPIFMIGVLLMSILIMNLYRQGKFNYKESLTPTSCRAVLVKLDRRIPVSWSTECDGNNLNVIIQKEFKVRNEGDLDDLRAVLYRELANDFVSLASNSPSDNLERTQYVSIKIVHPRMEIGALSEGRYVVKFATLTDQRLLMEHLEQTVQVQERVKSIE
jgi:hypothetical protein